MTDTERDIREELLIGADPEDVWQALTSGTDIARWFAIDAESVPGPEGVIRLRWNREHPFSDLEIIEWEPETRLKLSWRTSLDPERDLPLEFRLQRTDGGTLLRMVHSGFLSDASWDDEYDSHARGWHYELRSLKYYLEHFAGRTRQIISRRIALADREEAWRTLTAPGGIFDLHEGLDVDAAARVRLPAAEPLSARVFLGLAGSDLALIVDALDGGILRLSFETFSGQPEVYLWAMSWHLAQDQLERLALPVIDAVQGLLDRQREAS